MTHRPLVLLVDGDADSRNILRTVLEYSGYEAAEADSVRAAVLLTRQLRPALVLVELEMNSLSGFDLLSLLRLDPLIADIPVVAVSHNDLEPEARACGFSDFIAKPFFIPTIVATLRTALPLDAS